MDFSIQNRRRLKNHNFQNMFYVISTSYQPDLNIFFILNIYLCIDIHRMRPFTATKMIVSPFRTSPMYVQILLVEVLLLYRQLTIYVRKESHQI